MIVKLTDISGKGPKGSTIVKWEDINGNEDSILVWANQKAQLSGFSVDDWVNLQYSMNGKYKNFDSISGAKAPEGDKPSGNPSKSWNDSPYQKPKSPEEQESICRAVALEKAVMLLQCLKPGTMNLIEYQSAAIDVANEFLCFLKGEDTSFFPSEIPEP